VVLKLSVMACSKLRFKKFLKLLSFMPSHMKQLKSVATVLLLAFASVASSLPVPPFTVVGEIASILVAAVLLTAVLFLTRQRWSFGRTAGLLLCIVLARFTAELTWMFALTILPDAFFFLPRLLYADGEGAYNLASYQVFLFLSFAVGLAFAVHCRLSSRPR